MRGADVDHAGWREPPRQRRHRESRQSGRDHRGDTAADKGLAPGDAGLVERADSDRPHAAGRRQRRQPQAFAAMPFQLL